MGLIPPGERAGTGQHRYPEQTVARLQKIDQLKALGLSFQDIGKVIHLYFEDPTGKRAKIKVLEMLGGHLAETDIQMASLTQFGAELMEHIKRFERRIGWMLTRCWATINTANHRARLTCNPVR